MKLSATERGWVRRANRLGILDLRFVPQELPAGAWKRNLQRLTYREKKLEKVLAGN